MSFLRRAQSYALLHFGIAGMWQQTVLVHGPIVLSSQVMLIFILNGGPESGACLQQDSVNALLQLYIMHLIDSGQHALIPLYACHLRADVRREVWHSPVSVSMTCIQHRPIGM